MYMFASAFEILADSLSKVTIESVLSLIGLGVAMMFLGAMAPFAILASLALAVFAVGLGAFGIASCNCCSVNGYFSKRICYLGIIT